MFDKEKIFLGHFKALEDFDISSVLKEKMWWNGQIRHHIEILTVLRFIFKRLNNKFDFLSFMKALVWKLILKN